MVFLGAVPPDRCKIRPGDDAENAGWFDMMKLPDLAFDHADILDMARARLRARLDDPATALRFLPRQFTLSELQQVCEVILRKPLDKRNFRKRILGLGLIEATGKDRRDGAHRPASLYRARRRRGSL